MTSELCGQRPPDAGSTPAPGPAMHAARRTRLVRRSERAYPLPLSGDGASGDAVVLAATRALLAAATREEVAQVLHTAVNDLGGGVLPARLAPAGENVIGVDVSLGVGEPRVVVADPISLDRMRLSQHLPILVQDALMAAARCDAARRLVDRAAIDALTRVATRREVGPRLAGSGKGDVVCMLDLDRFKQLNDKHGHAAGDRALGSLGSLLRHLIRDSDFCARYGGDEFLVLLVQSPLSVARARMQDLISRWAAIPGHGTGLSVGMAAIGAAGAAAALEAADQALYVAKHRGRGRIEVAPDDDKEQNNDH